MDFAGVSLTQFVGDITERSSLFTEGPRLRAEESLREDLDTFKGGRHLVW